MQLSPQGGVATDEGGGTEGVDYEATTESELEYYHDSIEDNFASCSESYGSDWVSSEWLSQGTSNFIVCFIHQSRWSTSFNPHCNHKSWHNIILSLLIILLLWK